MDVPAESPATDDASTVLRWFPVPVLRTERLPAALVASATDGRACKVVDSVLIGERVALKAGTDMTSLGNAIHACIAAAFTEPNAPVDIAGAARILGGFDLAAALDASALVRQISALDRWIAERWPACRRHAEIPIESVLASGQVMHGRIDLLLETAEGWVLLDHKSNPAPRDRWEQLAAEHGGQLSVYADALVRATGRPVTETWLVLPVAAGAIRIALAVDAPTPAV